MERVIRQVDVRGRSTYLRGFEPLAPGCQPLARWTYDQGKAKRFRTRTLAKVDLARIKAQLERGFGDDATPIEIVRLVGVYAAASALVLATRLAAELREKGSAHALARRKAEATVVKRFEEMTDALERVERMRKLKSG